METKKRGDLVINGFGASNGGQFEHVSLNGKGTVNSDVDCKQFECNGSGTVNGNVKAAKAIISGNGKIQGNIEGQSLTIDGTAKIANNLYVKKLKVSGKATVGGKVKSDDIKVRGRLTVEGNCEAETFKAESQFLIGGLLTADDIEIKLFGNCKAKEIGGQTIIIKHKAALLGLFKPLHQTHLETELIEGDKIEIESTKAHIVRGNNIIIGPNCDIDIVEYTGELTMDKKATVKEVRKG
jgi:cytoskeletal protein CcmA (bactofilin family)